MQARAAGQRQWGWLGRTSVTTSETKLRGHAEWGDCPESMQKQKGVPGKPPRYATVAGPGTQPAGWAGDRRRNADRGRRANVEDTSKSCGPGVVEQLGVLEIHLRQDRSEG